MQEKINIKKVFNVPLFTVLVVDDDDDVRCEMVGNSIKEFSVSHCARERELL